MKSRRLQLSDYKPAIQAQILAQLRPKSDPAPPPVAPRKKPPSSGELRMANILEGLRLVGIVKEWKAQHPTIQLAPDCQYTLDFWLRLATSYRQIVIEVKGKRKWEDGRIKFKWAAAAALPDTLVIYWNEVPTGTRIEYYLNGERIPRPHWSPL